MLVENESQSADIPDMPSQATAGCPPTLPLCLLAPGVQAEVFKLGGKEAVNHRLRELGFCEAAKVKKLSGKTTVMCEVCGTKLALSADLARLIHVQPIAHAPAAGGR
jgi:ferrous iron transport protein A